MKNLIRFLFFSTVFLSALLYAATDYYVDATSGSDSNSGRSTSSAWRTIDKVNNYAFAPGDRILFKRGNVWREQLKATSSGYSGNPITYGAYGSGNRPVILGSVSKNSTSDWNRETGNLWYTTNNNPIWRCIFNRESNYSRRETKKADLNAQGEIWWDSSNSRLYLYSTSNPASYYGGSVECAQLINVIHANGKSHLRFENLDVRYTSASAFNFASFEDITVISCTIKYTGETYSGSDNKGEWSGAGIYTYNGNNLTAKNNDISFVWIGVYMQRTSSDRASHLIDGNTISYCIMGGNTPCESHGIAFGGTAMPDYTGTVVSNNTISNFGSRGIALSHSRNVIVENNVVHTRWSKTPQIDTIGIYMGTTGSSGHKIRYNHVYNVKGSTSQWNAGIGIGTREAKNSQIYYNVVHDCDKGIYNALKTSSGNNDNNKIYNNVCYRCSKYGIWINDGISGNMLNVTIRNNICDGGQADIRLEDYVKATGGYNCLINSSSVSKAGSSTYSTSSTDFYSADPLFTNASANNFSLRSNSPCIDKGADNGVNRDFAGNAVPKGMAVDMGALEYQSSDNTNPTPPNVTISASPKSGTAPLSVSFDCTVSGGESPYSYAWNFGDGSTSTVKSPAHTFNKTGSFTVTLTVTDNASQKDSDTEYITVSNQSSSQYTLSISATTGSPASGTGGSVDPAPGNHTYASGERVLVSATPKAKYRFGKWTGDVVDSAMGSSKITLTMGGNKSVEAIFCSLCGDVNGDFAVTPTDAQLIFDIFLGKLKNPTYCQKENADVNCDGTQSNPNITPFDAQAIFDYYLGKAGLPSDCSCNSRAAASAFTINPMTVSEFNLFLDMPQRTGDGEVYVPILIDRSIRCDSFGLDLLFNADGFEFAGIIRTELTEDFLQVDGNVTDRGILRIGGYRENSQATMLSGELCILVFKSRKETIEPVAVKIIKTYDDLKRAYIN